MPDWRHPLPVSNDTAGGEEGAFDAIPEEEAGIDPAFYLLGAFILFVILYFVISNMRKKDDNDGDDFFASLDTEKVSLHARSVGSCRRELLAHLLSKFRFYQMQ